VTAGGKTTTYGYVRNWLSSVTDAMGNTESYSLDWAGNVTTKYDRNGNTTDYTYDGLGRLKTSSAGGPTESRTYTQTGQLKEASNGILTIKYKYNEAGQLWKEEDFLPGAGSAQTTKTYTYDANGNRTKLETTGTGGLTQSYVYDRMNRMTDMYENGTFAGVPAVSYKYDHAGNRETMTYNKGTANEVVESYTYNGLNQVKKLENKRNGTYLSKYEYEYQHDGAQYEKKETKYNASGVQADVITTTYAYDGMGRLKGESDGVTAKTYKYEDDKGAYKTNRLKMTVSGADNYIVNYSYDGNNRLTEERRVESAATYISSYCYDNNGNQTAKLKAVEAVSSGPAGLSLTEAGTGWELYEYDEFNRLTEALVEGVTTKYTYRPDGLRNSKASGSTTTTFLWDGWNMIAENKGGTIKTYLYGINLVKNDSSYYLYNAHGDVVHLTDGSGLVTWNYDYDAFGNERNPDPNDTNPFRYCGEYLDFETNNYYLRARYYNPTTGRFTQQDDWGYADPNDPLSLNLYTFCYNNPVMYVDPSGHIVQLADGISSEDRQKLLNEIRKLTDHTLLFTISSSGIWTLAIYKYATENIKYKAGNDLIERVIKTDKIITIELNNDNNFDATADNEVYASDKNKGTGTTIRIDFNYTSIDDNTPLYIAIGHELIHADKNARGAVEIGKYAFQTYVKDPKAKEGDRKVHRTELATVGLKYNKKGEITENMLRKEHNLPKRKSYIYLP